MNILNIKNLTKTYDSSHGIFNFNLTVNSGDIVLLLGPNGAGKTTAFNSILGLTPSEYEDISLMGENLSEKNRRYIGAMVSKPSFYEEMTAIKYLTLFGDIYSLNELRVLEVLEMVGLESESHKKIQTYSTGMKQRLDFARAIVHQPQMLLLDEPFSGMDIEAKHDFKKILKSLKDTGIVISSHMVGDLERLANKVVIVSQGRTLFNGEMKDIEKSGLTLEEFYLQRIQGLKEAI